MLPPSYEKASCFLDGRCFEFSSDMSGSLLAAIRGQKYSSNRTGLCKPYICCFFIEGYLESLAEELFDVPAIGFEPRLYSTAKGLREDIERLVEEARRSSPEARAITESLATLVAVNFLRSTLPPAAVDRIFVARHPGIQSALKLIEGDFDALLTIDELAASAQLCRSYFIALFKQEIGRTPHEHLRKVRIQEAKRLLCEGKDVTDTCFAVGFTSLSGFEEAFIRLVGMTPIHYRALARS